MTLKIINIPPVHSQDKSTLWILAKMLQKTTALLLLTLALAAANPLDAEPDVAKKETAPVETPQPIPAPSAERQDTVAPVDDNKENAEETGDLTPDASGYWGGWGAGWGGYYKPRYYGGWGSYYRPRYYSNPWGGYRSGWGGWGGWNYWG